MIKSTTGHLPLQFNLSRDLSECESRNMCPHSGISGEISWFWKKLNACVYFQTILAVICADWKVWTFSLDFYVLTAFFSWPQWSYCEGNYMLQSALTPVVAFFVNNIYFFIQTGFLVWCWTIIWLMKWMCNELQVF